MNAPSTSFAPAPMYEKELKREKLKRKINSFILRKIDGTPLQFRLYRAYWHYKLNSNKKAINAEFKSTHFLTQKPNYGAGIGHQLANWNSGLYFSGLFKVRFAHFPFSTAKWENFLGFGEGELLAPPFFTDKRFKVVRLPRFNSIKKEEIQLIGDIINSYERPFILFLLEIDQGYVNQFDTYQLLSEKFFKAKARKNDRLIFSPEKFNIAIHIRRRMKIETEEVWKERGLNNDYYATILRKVLALLKHNKIAEVYLFSQGNINDFPEFKEFDNIHYCMDMGPEDSVLHMINADLLISSKSSFSYKPALISRHIQICPASFWHGYPSSSNYILADNSGDFKKAQLSEQLYSSEKLKGIYNSKPQ
ncbi:hypothetical protein [Mucilaginibacter gotjawali]|uniref:Uncharacterized protein n=1 Tax=Mucilaginibacter gotjawali TaxID=1550579 RepID=A0A839SBT1_9SPHI|nr:hypothetical protein [Mucilaginibacter gotjawali]MBB3054370.1 hypothetical protein [Mucilaginibacter gotjawali]